MDDEPGSSRDAFTPPSETSKSKKEPTKVFEVPDDLLKKPSEETLDPDTPFFQRLQESDTKAAESNEKANKSPLGAEEIPSQEKAPTKTEEKAAPLAKTLKRDQDQGGSDNAAEKKSEAPTVVAPISETSDIPEKKSETSTIVAPISETTDTPEKKSETSTIVAPISETTDTSEKKSETSTIVAPISETTDTPEKKSETSTIDAPISETSDTPEKKSETSDTPEKKSEMSTTVAPLSETSNTSDSENAASSADSKSPDGILKSKTKKSYFKKKRSSIVQFFTGKKSSEDEEKEKRPKPKRRPSYIRRKLIAFEKELTLDNVNKKVTSIFVPDYFKPDDSKEDKEEKEEEEEREPKRVSLSSSMACIFIISVTTGSGIAAVPFYLKNSGWFGIFFIMLLGLNSIYAGLCTGWCWLIMEEKWPEYLEYSRIPYQEMAFRAIGPLMKYIVAAFIDVSLLGNCAIYVLLMADASENIAFKTPLSFCYTLIVIVVVLMPFTMFGSYRNVKFIGIFDVFLAILFTFFLIISFFLDKPTHGPSLYTDPAYKDIVIAFSGFSFAYSAGPMIPSILSDMEDRTQFTQACATGFMVVLTIYLIPSILGYAAYGDETPRYIMRPILENENLYGVGVFLTVVHVLQLATSFILSIFPTLHAFEERLKCPDKFGCSRFMLRLIIVAAILTLILGVPSLQKYMEIVFPTSFSCTTFVFPPLIYVFMVYQQPEKSKRFISKKEWFLILETVLLGFIVSGIATRVGLNNFEISETDRVSCFTNWTTLPHSKLWITGTRGI